VIPLFLLALSAFPQPVSGDFPADLYGPIDTRLAGAVCAGGPCIWGHADSAVLPIAFHPPAGMRVRILSLRGTTVAWIKSLPGDPPTPLESVAGVLGGFQTTSGMAGTATAGCDYCAGGTPLYLQAAVGEKQPISATLYDYENLGTLLDADNILNAKIAAWLNTTNKPVHIEITYTIQFRYE